MIHPKLLSTAVLLGALAPAASAQISFSSTQSLAVGSQPAWSALSDFDGDGDLDVAVSVDAPDRVVFLFNDGTGAFPTSTSVLTGSGTSPHAVVAGDYDGNGSTDVAVTLKNVGLVQIILNQGNGTFALGRSAASGSESRDMAAGDIDGDGDLDLVCVNRESSNATVLVNQGAGTFASSTLATGGEPAGVALTDFDGDGDLDLAVSSRDLRRVEIYGNAGGRFTFATGLATPGDRPSFVATGDIDGDGDADVATTAGNVVWIFRNAGGLGFAAGQTNGTGGLNPSSVAIVDLDADGDLDLAVSNEDSNTLATLANGGTGTFGAAATIATGLAPQHVAAGDLTQSCTPDVVTADRDSGSIQIAFNAASVAARAEFRNPGSVNPASYTISNAPALGARVTLMLDVASTGHTRGTFVAYTAPASIPLGAGRRLLVDVTAPGGELLQLPIFAAPVQVSAVLPADPSLCGLTIYTQGVHVGGGAPFALSNALDLTFGS